MSPQGPPHQSYSSQDRLNPLPAALQVSAATPLVDIGANLTHESFAHDLDAVLERSQAANVAALVLTGTDLQHSRQAARLAERIPHGYATAGLHPHDARHWRASMASELGALHAHPKVVAVGECGLDFHRNHSSPAHQEGAFEAQLQLACEHRLPVFVHEREAGRRMREILTHWRDDLTDAVIHCFTGDQKSLFGYLDLDMHIGLTGWICDERRGHHLRDLVSSIPRERLMIETDCPYLLPRNLPARLKGRRHEPALLPFIAREIAHWIGISEAELGNASTRTAQAFFNLSPLQAPDKATPDAMDPHSSVKLS